MSTIETPPQDRLPVETIIAAYDERLIRDAIRRELDRGGQVFFLHNRVLDIESVALRLRALVPEARIVVGHGQMSSDELEEVMTRFVEGQADVLLSTTIIESGIDIPNANTIIIDRADRFGLSDLYQLRGRVGRYRHQAYAYLLIPRHAGLLLEARKRISAIKQFSTPGSGFKIAMRDLELRGAGNLLGKEQSGHITAIGFALYCQLLEQSVQALKGTPRQQLSLPTVRLDFLEFGAVAAASPKPSGAAATPGRAMAGFPNRYIPEAQHRLEFHRRLATVASREEIEAIRAELRDRFGPLPGPVELLLQVTALRILAATCGVTSIEVREEKVMLQRGTDYVLVGGKFPRLTQRTPKSRLNQIRHVLSSLPPLPSR
jgi:transcription-repair coupling factor (superfamily II helicase)